MQVKVGPRAENAQPRRPNCPSKLSHCTTLLQPTHRQLQCACLGVKVQCRAHGVLYLESVLRLWMGWLALPLRAAACHQWEMAFNTRCQMSCSLAASHRQPSCGTKRVLLVSVTETIPLLCHLPMYRLPIMSALVHHCHQLM